MTQEGAAPRGKKGGGPRHVQGPPDCAPTDFGLCSLLCGDCDRAQIYCGRAAGLSHDGNVHGNRVAAAGAASAAA
jgi:hypothetical protein